ncbi:hypothetical protein [Lacticaseibacillus jixiensis]|uniref:hypothetical protein n=1 Tax=Lacticaseibacillus jixiensis TaxID=3231926 RepID=UPI0036F410F6
MTQPLLYIPVVRRLFDAKTADERYTQMLTLLQDAAVVTPPHNLGDLDELADYLTAVHDQGPFAGIIFHNTSFTGAEFIEAVHAQFPTTPMLLVASKEPSLGGWLRLNGSIGLMSTGNYLHTHAHAFTFAYGDPTDQAVIKQTQTFIQAATLRAKLAALTIGVVGTFPTGFAFSGTDEAKLAATFGTQLIHYRTQTAFQAAEALPQAAYADELTYAAAHFDDLDLTLPETTRYVKFVALMRQWAKRDGFKALASRCWPDFFDDYHAAPGAVWSQLCDEGLPTAMECDIHGALSEYILQQLVAPSAPVDMLDLISSLDPVDNTISAWHDYAAFAHANLKYGVKASVHPNRKMPVSPQFVLKPGVVTMLRVSVDAKGAYSLVALRGKAIDAPAQFDGVSARIQLEQPVETVFDALIDHGTEQHFALVYGDVIAGIAALGKLLQLPTTIYANQEVR